MAQVHQALKLFIQGVQCEQFLKRTHQVTVLHFLAAALMKVPAVPTATGIRPALMTSLIIYLAMRDMVGQAHGEIPPTLTLLLPPPPLPCTGDIHHSLIWTGMLPVPLKQVARKLIIQFQLWKVMVLGQGYPTGVAGPRL